MTNNNIITEKLKEINNLEVKTDIPLREYTSFKIGGPADIFIIPQKKEALIKSFPVIKEFNIPYFVLGSGSNIIVSDSGYHGIIIYMGQLTHIARRNNLLIAETGTSLSKLASRAREEGLTGLEFAGGIPGSLGGAIFMNAGAYGGEMKQIIKKVEVINDEGKVLTLQDKDLKLSYRSSFLQQKNYIALQAILELDYGSKEEIAARMKELNQKRRDKQPLSWPSAGSIFKRPANDYAGRLIEAAGLKGSRIGDAQVSKKHAGFIINRGNATANEVKQLIEKVRGEVYEMSGIKLEVEPQFLGEFDS